MTFWATPNNRKWAILSFNMPWCYQICILSVFTLIETICLRICSKSRPKSSRSPLPLDLRRSKTSLLKLPRRARSGSGQKSCWPKGQAWIKVFFLTLNKNLVKWTCGWGGKSKTQCQVRSLINTREAAEKLAIAKTLGSWSECLSWKTVLLQLVRYSG